MPVPCTSNLLRGGPFVFAPHRSLTERAADSWRDVMRVLSVFVLCCPFASG